MIRHFEKSRNHLLKRLPDEVVKAMLRNAEYVNYEYREVVYSANSETKFVDFPDTGVVSLLALIEHQIPIEIVNIGNEGMLGSWLTSGVVAAQYSAVCQVEGGGIRFSREIFLKYLEVFPFFKQICKQYMTSLFERTARAIVCSRTHTRTRSGAHLGSYPARIDAIATSFIQLKIRWPLFLAARALQSMCQLAFSKKLV